MKLSVPRTFHRTSEREARGFLRNPVSKAFLDREETINLNSYGSWNDVFRTFAAESKATREKTFARSLAPG